jgi:hypothetical protein
MLKTWISSTAADGSGIQVSVGDDTSERLQFISAILTLGWEK